MIDPSVRAVADKLVECCREGREAELLDAHYAPDAVSAEAVAMPGTDSAEAHGVAAIKAKHDWWNGAFEVHEASITGPYFHGPDRFGVIFELDTTERASGNRMPMKEFAVYTVADGKITREEFYYEIPAQ